MLIVYIRIGDKGIKKELDFKGTDYFYRYKYAYRFI